MSNKQIETLENRRLLAADLSVAAAGNTFPANLVAGAAIKAPSASFTVSSSGAPTKAEGKTKVTLNVTLQPVGGGTAVATASKSLTVSSLKKPKTNKFTFSKLKVAPAAGSYEIVASLSNTAAAGDTNTANDSDKINLTVTAPTPEASPFGTTLGNKITFTTTKSLKTPAVAGFRSQTQETGTWSDNAGHSGTFKYTTGGNDAANGLMALVLSNGTPIAGLKFSSLSAGKDAPKIGKGTYVFGGAAKFATVVFAGNTINVAKGK